MNRVLQMLDFILPSTYVFKFKYVLFPRFFTYRSTVIKDSHSYVMDIMKTIGYPTMV